LLIFPFTTPTAAALDLQNAVHDWVSHPVWL
jgi:hypothetical protein